MNEDFFYLEIYNARHKHWRPFGMAEHWDLRRCLDAAVEQKHLHPRWKIRMVHMIRTRSTLEPIQ